MTIKEDHIANTGRLGWMRLIWRVYQRISQNRIGLMAAGIAFYGLLSLFPAITAAVAMVGWFFDANILLANTEWILSAMPEAASNMITAQMTAVASARSGALGWAAVAALAIAFWSASRGVASLIDGLNAIYDEDEKRGYFTLQLITIVMTLALILGLSASVIVVAAIPATLAMFGDSDWLRLVSLSIRWPVMLGLGIFGVAMLYRYAPSRARALRRWLSPGAVLACTLWVAATLGFSYYVQTFGNYNETFGALGGVVIMLTWLWLSAFVILLGAQVDAEIDANRPSA
jgi:membrane protein